jgi:flagellar basal-body rod protein FlgB
VDEISSAVIIKALEGLSLRQQYTAQNIANAGSPNYTPMRVTFEESLQAAARGGLKAIHNVAPKAEAVPLEQGSSGVRLDLELATATQTASRYGALMDLLGRQLALKHALISDRGR